MIANGEERRKEAQKSALAMRARFSRGDLPPCPVAVTLRVVGNRWRPLILQRLATVACGHAALLAAFRPLLTQKVLTENLRALEGYGLLSRETHPTNPPTVTYALTPLGRTFLPVLETMAEWGERFRGQVES